MIYNSIEYEFEVLEISLNFVRSFIKINKTCTLAGSNALKRDAI